jgi:phosphocarrier protein HPr
MRRRMIKKQFNITNDTGFARPATLLVSLADRFTSDIFLEFQKETVKLKHSAKSIMDILSLGIKPGAKIYIKAVGTDEVQAIQSIKEYLNEKRLIND